MANFTVQKIIKAQAKKLHAQNKFSLMQHSALSSLSACRTATLGGHAQRCPKGHLNGVWYNSCKHRACPQCQGMASEQWLQNTQVLLLNCTHHHMIFTLPSELHPFWRYNREALTDILFKATSDTLKQFSDDARYLAAKPGILSALHTWGRSLNLHPHIHALISHGGLNKDGVWVKPKKKHLFPQKPLMQVFRGKLLSYLRKAMQGDKWVYPPDQNQQACKSILSSVRKKAWVVHCCKPYKHANGVAKYLSKYVKRSPFKNAQIKAADNHHVRFVYQSHQTGKQESMRLSTIDFIKRLLQHIPLKGKPTVRYTGLYSGSSRKRLNQAKLTLGQSETVKPDPIRWPSFLSEKDYRPVCEICGLPIHHEEVIERKQIAA